jgi:hypothetical protein
MAVTRKEGTREWPWLDKLLHVPNGPQEALVARREGLRSCKKGGIAEGGMKMAETPPSSESARF